MNDPALDKIANHLKKEINSIAAQYLKIHLINGIRSYDAYNVGLHEYPLLKVFRSYDLFKSERALNQSSITISYCLSYPDQERLAPLCFLVGQLIHHSLNDAYTRIGIDIQLGDRRCEYRTSENELGQPVKTFVNYYFTINESSKPRFVLEGFKNE